MRWSGTRMPARPDALPISGDTCSGEDVTTGLIGTSDAGSLPPAVVAIAAGTFGRPRDLCQRGRAQQQRCPASSRGKFPGKPPRCVRFADVSLLTGIVSE